MSANQDDFRGASGNIHFNRRVLSGRLFWLPVRTPAGVVGLGLTGTGNRATATTPPVTNEDLVILAGLTNLDASLVTLREGERAWSNTDVPIKQLFGKRQLARNILYYKPPFPLSAGKQVIADALGVAAETDGHLVFLCDPVNAKKRVVTIPENAYPFTLRLPLSLAGTATERPTRTTAISKTHHTFVWGGGTDLSSISIKIRDAEGATWMIDPVPIWAICGFSPFTADPRTMGQVITQMWPRGYYIPPGGALQVEVAQLAAALEANGFIDFFCARWEA